LEVAVAPVTAYSWDDLVLLIHMTWDIRINVDSFLPARSGMRRSASRTVWILFVGPPGCRKTLASNIPAKFISVLGTAEVDDGMLRYAMDLVRSSCPAGGPRPNYPG
jgi:hypothetical protein